MKTILFLSLVLFPAIVAAECANTRPGRARIPRALHRSVVLKDSTLFLSCNPTPTPGMYYWPGGRACPKYWFWGYDRGQYFECRIDRVRKRVVH